MSEHCGGRLEHHLTHRCQLDATRTSGSIEDPLTDRTLQRSDLLADGRLGEAEPFCGPSERAFDGDSLQGAELAKIDVL